MVRILAGLMILAALAGCETMSSISSISSITPPPSTYVVFFGPGSAELPPEARVALDQAAAAIHRQHPARVAIASGVAKAGTLELAEPRYIVVRKALADRGVKQDLIARASLPDSGATLDNAAYQRVEIILGGN